MKSIAPGEGEEGALSRVLCYSEGRAEKERGIDRLKEQRLLEDLGKMCKAIAKGTLKDPAKANLLPVRVCLCFPIFYPKNPFIPVHPRPATRPDG